MKRIFSFQKQMLLFTIDFAYVLNVGCCTKVYAWHKDRKILLKRPSRAEPRREWLSTWPDTGSREGYSSQIYANYHTKWHCEDGSFGQKQHPSKPDLFIRTAFNKEIFELSEAKIKFSSGARHCCTSWVHASNPTWGYGKKQENPF